MYWPWSVSGYGFSRTASFVASRFRVRVWLQPYLREIEKLPTVISTDNEGALRLSGVERSRLGVPCHADTGSSHEPRHIVWHHHSCLCCLKMSLGSRATTGRGGTT